MKSYYIEVKEDGINKIVPHNIKTKEYRFSDSENVKAFLEELQKNNIGTEFRMVTETLTVSNGGWEFRTND